jgi:hypothetical protein
VSAQTTHTGFPPSSSFAAFCRQPSHRHRCPHLESSRRQSPSLRSASPPFWPSIRISQTWGSCDPQGQSSPRDGDRSKKIMAASSPSTASQGVCLSVSRVEAARTPLELQGSVPAAQVAHLIWLLHTVDTLPVVFIESPH